MMIGALAIGIAAAAMMATPQGAHASWGVVTGAAALNLRSCASASCPRLTAMPNGAQVWIDGVSGGWYHVTYNGVVGYASARYISTGGSVPAPVVKRPQPTYSGGSSGGGSSGSSSGGGGYGY
jgi:uncharacterized protein YraI